MTVDQEHKHYYETHPNGNHEEPSGETLRFMERQNEVNEKVDSRLGSIETTLARMEEKIDKNLAQAIKTNGRVDGLEGFRGAYEPMLATMREKQRLWYSGWVGLTINMVGAGITAIAAIFFTLSRVVEK